MKNKRPKFRIYTVMEKEIDTVKMKKTLLDRYRASRVSIMEGDNINSVILTGSMQQLNNIWTFLKKKRGIKKVWMGQM
jgi:hypothetical protein